MSRVDRNNDTCRRFMRAGLLSASVLVAGLAALAPSTVQAQSLRGQITEEEANSDLLIMRKPGRPAGQGNTQPAASPTTKVTDGQTNGASQNARRTTTSEEYEPISDGGRTAAEEAANRDPDSTIADDTATPEPNDPFADADAIPAPRPRSALRRNSQETDADNRRATRSTSQRPQTAAERRRAEGQEDPVTTGTTRSSTIDADNREELTLDRGAERERAIEGLARRPDDRPFDPVGIRAGTFILRPSFEQGATYSTNTNSSSQGSEGVLSESTLRLNAVSDWSEHRATIDAYGIFRKSLSGEDIQQTEGGISGTLDYDLSREFKLKTAAGYAFKPESASSPVMLGNVVEQPLRQTFNASVGVAKELGKLELGITASGERNIYGDAELDTGGTLNQDDRNATLGTIALRGGYEISPAIKPFVELEAGRRLYDEQYDSAGYQRSADRLGASAGIEVDVEDKLTGEFSAGWLRESFDDDRLGAISGLALAADLKWSPERDTTIGLRASTSVEGTTTAGESGSLLHSGRLTMERQIRSNVTANAALGVDWRMYSGTSNHDLLLSGEIGATWWLSRYLGLTGRLKHEQMTSDLPNRDYKSESVFLGVKVQR